MRGWSIVAVALIAGVTISVGDAVAEPVSSNLGHRVELSEKGWLPQFPGGGLTGVGLDDVIWDLSEYDPDGDGPAFPLLIAGGEFLIPGTSGRNLAVWNGSAWSSFPESPVVEGTGSVAVTEIATFDEDAEGPNPPSLFVGGDLARVGALPTPYIARWNGQGWSSVGGGLNGRVRALAVLDPDGPGGQTERLFVGGDFSIAGQIAANKIAVWNGSTWSALGAGVGGPSPEGVFSFAAFDDDGAGPRPWSTFASGWFFGSPGNSPCVARWNAASGLWENVGAGVDGQTDCLLAMDIPGDGLDRPVLVATGYFASASGVTARYVAHWNGSNWQELVPGSWTPNGPVSTAVFEMARLPPSWGSTSVICGNFVLAAGSPANGVAFFENGAFTNLGAGVDGRVTSVIVIDTDGPGPNPELLVVGGDFGSAGGYPASNIAAWGLLSPPPPPCPDVSGDGVVNFVDITQILSTWGTLSAFGDANQDGVVNFGDITLVLARWGESCP